MANNYMQFLKRLNLIQQEKYNLEREIYNSLHEIISKQIDFFVDLSDKDVKMYDDVVTAIFVDKTRDDSNNIFIKLKNYDDILPFMYAIFAEDMLYIYKKVCEVTNEEEDKQLTLF